jgi:hypothetical protein
MLTKDFVGDFTTEQILLQSLDANPSNRTVSNIFWPTTCSPLTSRDSPGWLPC